MNYDSRICKLGDDFVWESPEHFIRPCLDSKIFTGSVFNKEEWEAKKKVIFSKGYVTSATPDTLIQIANTKVITQEVRVWVVDGKIVTQSTYRRGSFKYYDNIVDTDALEFAQRMIDIFQLSKSFVIDVCLTSSGWKIVECGSISCAGFYDADMQRIVFALEDAYNPKESNPSLDEDEYLR
ncbi:MAG: ATP-grasp domain-containing protein [Candidatus Pacearchaeota archaeon]